MSDSIHTIQVHTVPAYTVSIGSGLLGQCGTLLRGNCYKCGDLTDHPHYLSWSAINSETPNFHRSDDFGLFFFG